MGTQSIFQTLYEIDVSKDLKQKNGLDYLPWSKAWATIKTIYPDATHTIHKDENGCNYFTDGRTAWVEVSITINGETQTESLAVMDYRNLSIPLESITSVNVGKSIKRCLVKCAALFGLGLSLWTGEELSDAAIAKKKKDLAGWREKIIDLATEKIDGGVPKETVYAAIAEIAGSKNPNSIKDDDVAKEVFESLSKLKPEAKTKTSDKTAKEKGDA